MEQLQSEQINELFTALAKAQGEIKAAQKDSNNPFHKSRYADLSSVMEACKTALTANNLTILQTPTILNGAYVLITTLGHSSGQWIKAMAPLLMGTKVDCQAYGSAMTYMRRFSLAAMVGVCPEDDDGERERIRQEKEDEKERLRLAQEEKAKQQPQEPNKPTPGMTKKLGEILLKCPEEFRDSVNEGLTAQGYKMLDDLPLDEFLKLANNAKKVAGIA